MRGDLTIIVDFSSGCGTFAMLSLKDGVEGSALPDSVLYRKDRV